MYKTKLCFIYGDSCWRALVGQPDMPADYKSSLLHNFKAVLNCIFALPILLYVCYFQSLDTYYLIKYTYSID